MLIGSPGSIPNSQSINGEVFKKSKEATSIKYLKKTPTLAGVLTFSNGRSETSYIVLMQLNTRFKENYIRKLIT